MVHLSYRWHVDQRVDVASDERYIKPSRRVILYSRLYLTLLD